MTMSEVRKKFDRTLYEIADKAAKKLWYLG